MICEVRRFERSVRFYKSIVARSPSGQRCGFLIELPKSARPYRLTVRTQGSHPCNPGSIPGKVTTGDFSDTERSFLFNIYL